ncbi:helix-turn-helix domain-containing protein [Galbibacter marinus]|uniref:Helix-turn-helix domain-containing protein n=1 Tax=Galbibacter marinus TaxID=555500 RepID=K2NZC6_9FLAO|nr:helix-turn-helix transcriptional regulator [Galbibacter marinus]EKF54153.1 helix-turn-helix domain-containing protein [Galbibacter marinus]
MEDNLHRYKNISIANQRISSEFFALLDSEYSTKVGFGKPVNLRAPNDYAQELNIHVNHLNRVLKKTTQKTTSQLITERILQKARHLLKEKNWNIAEIAYSLGFKEATHFSNFFKRHTSRTPRSYRKYLNVVCYCLMDVVCL